MRELPAPRKHLVETCMPSLHRPTEVPLQALQIAIFSRQVVGDAFRHFLRLDVLPELQEVCFGLDAASGLFVVVVPGGAIVLKLVEVVERDGVESYMRERPAVELEGDLSNIGRRSLPIEFHPQMLFDIAADEISVVGDHVADAETDRVLDHLIGLAVKK